MRTYFETLNAMAKRANVPLKTAFIAAGVPDSTYYRTLNGGDLRHDTAERVFHWLASRLRARGHDPLDPPAAVDVHDAA